jgi:hypothetical protein
MLFAHPNPTYAHRCIPNTPYFMNTMRNELAIAEQRDQLLWIVRRITKSDGRPRVECAYGRIDLGVLDTCTESEYAMQIRRIHQLAMEQGIPPRAIFNPVCMYCRASFAEGVNIRKCEGCEAICCCEDAQCIEHVSRKHGTEQCKQLASISILPTMAGGA